MKGIGTPTSSVVEVLMRDVCFCFFMSIRAMFRFALAGVDGLPRGSRWIASLLRFCEVDLAPMM